MGGRMRRDETIEREEGVVGGLWTMEDGRVLWGKRQSIDMVVAGGRSPFASSKSGQDGTTSRRGRAE